MSLTQHLPGEAKAFSAHRSSIGVRLALLGLIIVFGLTTTGCLVKSEDYDEAKRQRDQYRSDLQEMYLKNEQLNKEITTIYNDCDLMTTQLALMAAMNLHNRYTADLSRSRVAPTPPPSAGGNVATTRTKPRPAATTTPSRSAGSTPPPPVVERPAQAPPPPARPASPLGSVDWGGM